MRPGSKRNPISLDCISETEEDKKEEVIDCDENSETEFPEATVISDDEEVGEAKELKKEEKLQRELSGLLRSALLYLKMSSKDLYSERVQTENTSAAELSFHNGETSSQISADQPRLLTGAQMKPFQVEGFLWLKRLYMSSINGILADEMGLGKTIQSIALICDLVAGGSEGPFLVCCPLSTALHWAQSLQAFAPQVPMVSYYGDPGDRSRLRSDIYRNYSRSPEKVLYPVVVTSYEVVMKDVRFLESLKFSLLILDEGHRIKNSNCRLVEVLNKYNMQHRILLTGTPLQNNINELFSLLRFIMPQHFINFTSLENWLNEKATDKNISKFLVEEEEQSQLLSVLHQILTPFMLRRLKSDVDILIPPKRETLVFTNLTSMQRDLYERILENYKSSLSKKNDTDDQMHCCQERLRFRSWIKYEDILEDKGLNDKRQPNSERQTRTGRRRCQSVSGDFISSQSSSFKRGSECRSTDVKEEIANKCTVLDLISDDQTSASNTQKCVSECGDLFAPIKRLVSSDHCCGVKTESDLDQVNLVSEGGTYLRKPRKCRSTCGDVPTCKKHAAASDSPYDPMGVDSYPDFANVDWMCNDGTRSRKVRKCNSVYDDALAYTCKQQSTLDSDIKKEILLNFVQNNFESTDEICSTVTLKSQTCTSLSPVGNNCDDSLRQVKSDAAVVLPKLHPIYKEEIEHQDLSGHDKSGPENVHGYLSELSSESGYDDDNTHLPGTESATRNEDASGALADNSPSADRQRAIKSECWQDWFEATTCESLVEKSNTIKREYSEEEEEEEEAVRDIGSNFIPTSNQESDRGSLESGGMLEQVETWSFASFEGFSSLSDEEEQKGEDFADEEEVEVTKHNIHRSLSLLRQCCSHPYLIEHPVRDKEVVIDERLVTSSGKMIILDKMLTKLKANGHKVLIFCQMIDTLDYLADYCEMAGHSYTHLDGRMNLDVRTDQIETFCQDDDTFVFLLSTRAGGFGLNLTQADTVIIFESDWNPQRDIQAQDRCHRIGQDRPVVVFRLVAADTIDQIIYERAAGKRKLEQLVIHKEKFKSLTWQRFAPFRHGELQTLLGEVEAQNAKMVAEKKVEEVTDEYLDSLLDRSDLHKEWNNLKATQRQHSKQPSDSVDNKATNTAYSEEQFCDIGFCIQRLLGGGSGPLETFPDTIDLEIPDSDVEIVGKEEADDGALIDLDTLSSQESEIVEVDSLDSDDVMEVHCQRSEEIILV